MKPPVLGIVVAIAVIAAGYLFFAGLTALPEQEPEEVSGLNLYASGEFGVSFAYPKNYILAEKQISDEHYEITLIKEEDAVPVIAGGEGPTSVTLSFYTGSSTPTTLTEWLTKDISNFKLGDGTFASTTVDSADAVTYGWSGLYEGETTAFLHNKQLIAVSVTYMSPSDPIRTAYEIILGSLTLR